MPDRIILRDIRFHGHHGVTKSEREVGQWYSVDVELVRDLSMAGQSDDLEHTVDYADVSLRVVEIGTSDRFCLIEALAETIGKMALDRYPVERVKVRVVKTPPADVVRLLAPRGSLAYSAVEIERSR